MESEACSRKLMGVAAENGRDRQFCARARHGRLLKYPIFQNFSEIKRTRSVYQVFSFAPPPERLGTRLCAHVMEVNPFVHKSLQNYDFQLTVTRLNGDMNDS